MYPYNTPYQAAGEPAKPDKMFADLLMEAMVDEATDILYYDKLGAITIDPADKEVLRHIHMDEKKHLKALTDIYQMLTGSVPTVIAKDKPISNNAHAEYGKSVYNELEGMEFYRKLFFTAKSSEIKDILFEILTDEIAHSIKTGHLFAKASGPQSYIME